MNYEWFFNCLLVDSQALKRCLGEDHASDFSDLYTMYLIYLFSCTIMLQSGSSKD